MKTLIKIKLPYELNNREMMLLEQNLKELLKNEPFEYNNEITILKVFK